jgi:DNA-binding winged helix-turn-helix (wHTH) protein
MSAMADFLLGDRRVRPSRNLVERAAGPGAPGAPGTLGRLGTSGAKAAVESAEQPAAVQVERKVMEVLVCLARSPGRVVTKDELVREVWDGRFVSDDVVWRSVRELRRALGDETRAPRYIETIPRRGYRLLAAVAEIPETDDAAAVRTGAEAPDPPTSVTLAAEAAGPAPEVQVAAVASSEARPRSSLLRAPAAPCGGRRGRGAGAVCGACPRRRVVARRAPTGRPGRASRSGAGAPRGAAARQPER